MRYLLAISIEKKLIYLLPFLFIALHLRSQDVTFNNVQQSLVYLNPSFSGSNGYIRNQSVYRNQWPNLSGTYVYYNTSFDGFIKKLNAGVSFSAYSNNIGRGIIKQRKFSAAYAQYISLPNTKIKIIPSVQLNYGLNTLDRSKLSFSASYPNYGLNYSSISSTAPSELVNYFDVNAGLLIKANHSYFGVVFSNLLQPNIAFAGTYKTPVKLLLHASTNLLVNPRLNINLFGSTSLQDNYYSANVRILNTYNNMFMYGIGYRYNYNNRPVIYDFQRKDNDVSFFLGLKYKILTVTYAYDIYVRKSAGNLYGSHELAFSLSFIKKGSKAASSDLESQ